MQGPSSRGLDLTDPVKASRWWADEAARYRDIATDASGAAARAWDRGDQRGCEVAIQMTEQALRWCEACAGFATAWERLTWAADCDAPDEGPAEFLCTGDAARDAEACVEMARDACRAAVTVRRLTRTVASCEAETLCAGAVAE